MSTPETLHRLSLVVPAAQAEWVLAELADLAPEGFEEHEEPDGRVRYVLYALPEARDALRSRLEALAASVPAGPGPGALDGAAPGAVLGEETLPNENWREAWKEHFQLQRIGRFVIRPSWIPYDPEPGEQVIHLDPGSAFGSGLHATTRLCLQELLALAEQGRSARRVLDFGAGTGILSLGACGLWPCAALAVDDDPLARQATRENAARNGRGERITAAQGLPSGAGKLDDDARFDLILANIQRPVLLEHAATLASLLAPAGTLVLSGLLLSDEVSIAETYRSLGLELAGRRQQDEWIALRFLLPHLPEGDP